MLNTGERQVGTDIEHIRRDHVARYEWAAERLKGRFVVDAACGVGYGSKILASAGCRVHAFDRDPEAIQWAKEHFNHDERIEYTEGDLCRTGSPKDADAVVCFEALEHLTHPEKALQQFHKMASALLVSVPNEDVFPYKGYRFHVRHYTKAQLTELLEANGWRPIEWYGQDGPESPVEPNVDGRTLVAVCERVDGVEPPRELTHDEIRAAHALNGKIPHSVAIVAMGASAAQYVAAASTKGNRRRLVDEVWAINAMAGVIEHDRVFLMDDLAVQAARAEATPDGNVAGQMDWVRNHGKPIYTSRAYGEYPATVEYPLEWVLNTTKHCYFNNTVPFAFAFALALGVKEVQLFGCDYSYESSQHAHKREKGRACLEYWIALASQAGVRVVIPGESTLLDANEKQNGERVYGYHTEWVTVEMTDGGFSVGRTPKKAEDIPTPEQIEREYCHDLRLERGA